MVATDGHRLAFISVQESPGKKAERRRAAAAENAERSRAADRRRRARSEFSQGENHLFFRAGGRLLISRKIDANFPGATSA